MAAQNGEYLRNFMGEEDEEEQRNRGGTADNPQTSNPMDNGNAWPTGGEQAQPVELPENTPNWGNSNPAHPSTPATTQPDTSGWDTNGYSTPGYTAAAGTFGTAPSGWDQAKWENPNHQSPKYVVARILQSSGDMKDATARQSAIANIQKAYPGTTYNGKDKVTIPGVGTVDIFGGASAGVYSTAWQPVEEGGGNGQPVAGSLLSQFTNGNPSGGYNWAEDPDVMSMMQSNPGMFRTAEDAVGWGKKYYGWTDQGKGPGQPGTPATSGSGNPAAGAPGAPGGLVTPANSAGSGTTSDVNTALADPKAALTRQLMERMRQDLTFDRNDPAVKAQSDAYSANAERARRDYLSDSAESKSPYATGAMRGEERMTAEKLGQDTGNFEAQLMSRELTARREQIQSALDSMGAQLTEGERQQLQRELAQLDAATRNHATDSQNAQFYAGLSQSDKHFYDQLSQQDRLAYMDDAFRRSQLGQNDTQFRDTLGFNTADRQSYWDSVRRGLI